MIAPALYSPPPLSECTKFDVQHFPDGRIAYRPKAKPLAVRQHGEGSIIGEQRHAPAARQSGTLLHVEHVRLRCEQRAAAFLAADGSTVLIQPAEMQPRVVARCDCLCTLTMALPPGVRAGRVLTRGDAYAGPPEPWRPVAMGSVGEFYVRPTPWRVPTSWLWRHPAWRGPAYARLGATEPPGVHFGISAWRSLGDPALGALGGIALPDTLTPLTPDEAAAALATAYKRVTGKAPTKQILGLLVGQTALETGDWKSLHNYNMGNAKATASDPYYTGFRCWELVNGQKTWYEADDPMCRFAAHKTAADGAEHYIRVLAHRSNWWAGLQTGTVPGYVAGLTSSPAYFTANADEYARGLTARMDEFGQQAIKYAGEHKVAVVGTAVGVFALTFGGWYLYNTVTSKRKARAA